jgi:hypothetical protein
MQVLMREHKAVMDAGRERTFSPGVTYELPDGLAQQWCASGAATSVAAPVREVKAHKRDRA